MGPRSQITRAFRPIFLWVVIGWACAPADPGVPAKLEPGPVAFENELGHMLRGDYIPSKNDQPVLILMHGLGAGRGEWAVWTGTLAAQGFGSLVFDARGHGESGGPSWRTFHTVESWRDVRGDFHAAKRFLAARGVTSFAFGGASVGANLALFAAAEDVSVRWVLLLSPGFAYAASGIAPVLQKFTRPLIAVAAPNDPPAMQVMQWLAAQARGQRVTLIGAKRGHGADVLKDAEFGRELAAKLSAVSSVKTQASP
jgi:alpha-beta hydrolase superfamily lysophospholipase